MTDVHSKEIRSYNMSMIKSKDTKPEILVRKALFKDGYRFRIHDKKMPGKPDIVLKKYRTVIFIHGCFWHGHSNCKYYKVPKTRTEWWIQKIERNKVNDKINSTRIKRLKWKVITIYECDLKVIKLNQTLRKLFSQLSRLSVVNKSLI